MKRSVLIAFVLTIGLLALATQAAFLVPQIQPFKSLPVYASFSNQIVAKELPSVLPSLPPISGKISHDIEMAVLYQTQA